MLENGFVAYIVPKRVNGFGEGWVAMAQTALDLLSQSDKLGLDDFRVLMALMARLDFENLLVINQSMLADTINMKRQNVNRSIKQLLSIEVLLEGPKIGISRSYRLNPTFGWKGSAKNHVAALKEERAKKMKKANITGVI